MASAALIFWPLVCIALFRNLPAATALCVSILGGYLLLPSEYAFNFPLVPPLHKHNIPALIALVMVAIVLAEDRARTPALPGWLPRTRVGLCLLFLLILGDFGTVLTNGEPLVYGTTFLPGLRLYDAFSMLALTLSLILPILLGRKLLAFPEAQRTLLLVLAVSGLIYCLPSLYEVRMSPQLHTNVYGYFPHSFLQSLRGGGFRPSVFLSHGLELSMFLVAALLAACGLYRTSRLETRAQFLLVTGFIFVTLVLAKSLGPLVIALLVLPIALFLKPRMQLIFAACIAGVVLAFPMLRSAGLVPTESIVRAAATVDTTRAASLSFRFHHEDMLLEKAKQKPVFGWGGWGRGRVFDEYGKDISVTDGAWVVQFGTGGWVRYLGIFGLLCWPVISLLLFRRDAVDPVCAALVLILAAKLLDLIPNGAMPPFIWLVAGSLLGRLEMKAENREETAVSKPGYRRKQPSGATPASEKGPQYARRFHDKEKVRARPGRARRHTPSRRSAPGP